MRHKHEIVGGHKVSCWDNGPKWADRYTVVLLDSASRDHGRNVPWVVCLCMGGAPASPNGFCQTAEMPLGRVGYRGRGGAFVKRIRFSDLPEACQVAARRWLAL